MARSIFSQPRFNDEATAYAYVEARLGPMAAFALIAASSISPPP